MKRILLVDSHPVFRRGAKEVLTEDLGRTMFGEAGDAKEGLERLREQSWDLVLLGIVLTGRTGLELLEETAGWERRPPVLVVSMCPEAQYAKAALRMGACGFVTKTSSAEELARAVRKVLRGGKYISEALAEALAADLATGRDRPREQMLSGREMAVLRGLARGDTVKGLAADMGISAKTVGTFRVRLLRKLGLKTNAELTQYAMVEHLMVD